MKCYTHTGVFHADEVLATAILREIARYKKNEKFSLSRVLEAPEDEDAIIFDIGGGKYDHHSCEIEYRDNGVPYASAGLIWRDFGSEYLKTVECSDAYIFDVLAEIDENLIQAVDARDNGYKEYSPAYCPGNVTLSDMVAFFNPIWNEIGSHGAGHSYFWTAVNVTQAIFRRFVKRIVSEYEARSVVVESMAKAENHILILEHFVPWQKLVVNETDDIWFVIYPSKRGGYNWQVVPKSEEDSDPRCAVPSEWWGVDKETLQKLSGVDDAMFCHRNGFLGSCESVEGCQKMVERAMR